MLAFELFHHKAHEGNGEHGKGGHGKHGGPGMGFHKEMKDLNLTDAQREAFHTAMKKQHDAQAKTDDKRETGRFEGMRPHMKEVAENFVSDQFDAKVAVGGDRADIGAKWATRTARFVETLIPILDQISALRSPARSALAPKG